MNKKYGGQNAYISNEDWITKNKLFDIQRIRTLLKLNKNHVGNYNANIAKRTTEQYMVKLLSDSMGRTYLEINNKFKEKVGRDIKKILRVQKDIRYVGELITLRDEKKKLYENIQNELIKIKKIEAEDLQSINNNTHRDLLINNVTDQYSYNEGEDNELIQSIINSVLSRMNINSIERNILGCTKTSNNTITSRLYFNKNTKTYESCKYLLDSLLSTICWKNIDLSKQGVGSIEDIALLMLFLVTKRTDFDINKEELEVDGVKKKCNIYRMFAPYIKNKSDREDKEVYIQPLYKQYKTVCKSMFMKKYGSKISVDKTYTKCDDVQKFLKHIYEKSTNKDSDKNNKKFRWESFAVFMYGLIKVTIRSIRQVFNEAMEEAEK